MNFFEHAYLGTARSERGSQRLPRRLAYPLIFALSIAMWSAIGLVFGAILSLFPI